MSAQRRKILEDLQRIGSAPAHQLLLFLLDCEANKLLTNAATFNNIALSLSKFFVRRNVTDQPGTNRLDPIFGGIIDDAQHEIKKTGSIGLDWFVQKMKGNKIDTPASDDDFEAALTDNFWYYDPTMARYILCRLNKSFNTREYDPNIWKQDDRGRFIWTVEHILPQGGNLRKEWVDMIGGGNKERARELQEQWVHCLGNLTLSACNSKLSDRPFDQAKYRLQESPST